MAAPLEVGAQKPWQRSLQQQQQYSKWSCLGTACRSDVIAPETFRRCACDLGGCPTPSLTQMPEHQLKAGFSCRADAQTTPNFRENSESLTEGFLSTGYQNLCISWFSPNLYFSWFSWYTPLILLFSSRGQFFLRRLSSKLGSQQQLSIKTPPSSAWKGFWERRRRWPSKTERTK